MSAKEKLLDFINEAGDVFGHEELTDAELEFEVNRVDDPVSPLYCTDLALEETNEVYRFCLIENPASLEETLGYIFAQYRELEQDYGDEFDGHYLVVRPDIEDAEGFFYLYRTDSGEIGLFHSMLSLDTDEDEDWDEEDDEDEDKTNGRREVKGE